MGCKENPRKIRKDFNVLKNNVVNIKWENSFTHKHSQVYLNLEQVGVCTWERREELFNSACFAHYSFYPASFLPYRILGLDSIQPWWNLIMYPSSYLSLSKIFSLRSIFLQLQFSFYFLFFFNSNFLFTFYLSLTPIIN